MFEMIGQNFLDVIVARLNDMDVRCHDSAIVHLIGSLAAGQLNQIVSFGDVTSWHNDRINKGGTQ